MQAAEEIQIAPGRETLIEEILFKQRTNAHTCRRYAMNVLPIECDCSSTGNNNARQDAYQQGLATSNRTNYSDDLTSLNIKLLDRERITARDNLFQSSYLQHCS